MRSILRWGIILAFCIMLFFVSAAPVFAQTTPDSGDDGLFPDAEGMDSANTISESSEVVRSRLVNIRLDLLPRPDAALGSQSSTNETLLLDLFDDVVYTATLDRIEPISADMYAWIGSLEGIEFSQVIMVVDNNDIISANITSPEGVYQVRYVSEGVHAVRQIDQSQFQGCALDEEDDEKTPFAAGLQGEMEMPPSLDSPTSSEGVLSDSGAVIDVLVVYTPAARSAVGALQPWVR